MRAAWPAAFVIVAGMTLAFLQARAPAPPPSVVEVAPGPTVVKDLRALARLETLAMKLEKIVEVKDHQTRLHGLVEADDALLFVARGEAVLGVDLAQVGDDDARFDPATKTAYVALPQPQVLSTRLDENGSHVHTRATDLLAKRSEGLEATARREAVAAFEKAAREPDAMERARANAEAQLRALSRSWGATSLVVTWKGPEGEVGVR
ncbi:MAG: DUF4230 domain-containing protein [Deltaproteobacteria bacterium]|nr:DUF4230 domain-containing protein [Deltaproteobacteria bacterium]